MTTVTEPLTTELPDRTLRNADIGSLVELLQTQNAHKVDIVVPGRNVRFFNGNLLVDGLDPELTTTGVYELIGAYRPIKQVDQQLANLTDVPVRYLRKTRGGDYFDRQLFDTNVNHWTERLDPERKVLLRLLWGESADHPGTTGIVRAILSDRYGIIDNFDTVLAFLDGLREAGLGAQHIRGADLSEDKLYLRVEAPELSVVAEKFLEGYRSPFASHGGETGRNPKLVHAGLLIKNSEVGSGAFEVIPELRIQICDNGAQITTDALRRIHLGSRLDEGQIIWSDATRLAANDLVKNQVRDAVASFLTVDYVAGAVAKLEETSGVEVADVTKTIEVVAKTHAYTETETAGLLSHFIKGGQLTAGGIFQAVTSYAQVIEDVDRANDFAGSGLEAMATAAKINA